MESTLTILAIAYAFGFLCALLSIEAPLRFEAHPRRANGKHQEIKIGFIAIFWTLRLDLSKPIILGIMSRRAGCRVDLLLAIFLLALGWFGRRF
jgi:hypothetical protein